jgi:hypothetical protein
MTDWLGPQDIREWFRRLFGLRPMLLMLLISSIFILELRFDWIERALGAYLVSTNAVRPESGAIWEKGKQTLTARKTLEQIVTDRQAIQREARGATTFNQIATNVSAGQGVMLSGDRFRSLFLNLAPEVAREIISPYELLGIASQGQWRRTYFEKAGGGLKVYLLDANNRVLRQLKVTPNVLAYFEHQEIAAVEALEDLRFFDALQEFPEEVRRSMLPQPEHLLDTPGQIMRVGISDEAVSGFIELGFEIINGSQRKVILIKGHEWAVWRLRTHLEEKRPGAGSAVEPQEKRTSQ